MPTTSRSATTSSPSRLRSLLVAGLAVAAVGAAAPLTVTALMPASSDTVLGSVQDQDLSTPAGSLGNAVTDPARRSAVVDQVTAALTRTATEEGGSAGRAFDAVESYRPGSVRVLVDRQIVGYANALQPYWDSYRSAGAAGGFGQYLAGRSSEVGDSLLQVGDRFAAQAGTGARVAYNVGRSDAQEDITAALPQIGSIMENATR